MTILKFTKRHLIISGILPLPSQNFKSKLIEYPQCINRFQNAFVYLMLISYAISEVCFLSFKAQTFIEYTEATFCIAVSTLALALYSILLWRKANLIDFMQNLELIVEQSKLSQ